MVTVRGVEGTIRAGYYPAGTVRAWTVTKHTDEGADPAWRLTATIVALDAFRVTQRPLAFVAPHANGRWRWPIDTLQIMGDALTARLGPPER
jgi:hypothetical protein